MAYKPKTKDELTPEEQQRKNDANQLAKLRLDIYKKRKIKLSPNNNKE